MNHSPFNYRSGLENSVFSLDFLQNLLLRSALLIVHQDSARTGKMAMEKLARSGGFQAKQTKPVKEV